MHLNNKVVCAHCITCSPNEYFMPAGPPPFVHRECWCVVGMCEAPLRVSDKKCGEQFLDSFILDQQAPPNIHVL